MPTRRHFGSVRKLPSGCYQASYWHLAERHTADRTFETKADARPRSARSRPRSDAVAGSTRQPGECSSATTSTTGWTTAAKAYRLLRAVLMTATADGLIVTNPCVIRGAGQERAPERKIPSLETVEAIATAVGDRYRALV